MSTELISEAQQLTIDAAMRVESGGLSLSEAARSIGLTIEQFQTKIGELLALTNRFGWSPMTTDTREVLRAVRAMAPVVEGELAPVAVAGGGLAVTEGSTGLLATVAGWLGISVGTLAIGALVVGAVAVGGAIYMRTRTAAAATEPAAQQEVEVVTPPEPCPPLVREARLCPWSPKSAAAKPCGPGYCWDGGFNGSLACKQEVLPDNASRIDLSGVTCNPGFSEQRDRCTNVVSACTRQYRID